MALLYQDLKLNGYFNAERMGMIEHRERKFALKRFVKAGWNVLEQMSERRNKVVRLNSIGEFLRGEVERIRLDFTPHMMNAGRQQDASSYFNGYPDIEGFIFPDGYSFRRPGVDPRKRDIQVWTLPQLDDEAARIAKELGWNWLPIFFEDTDGVYTYFKFMQ